MTASTRSAHSQREGLEEELLEFDILLAGWDIGDHSVGTRGGLHIQGGQGMLKLRFIPSHAPDAKLGLRSDKPQSRVGLIEFGQLNTHCSDGRGVLEVLPGVSLLTSGSEMPWWMRPVTEDTVSNLRVPRGEMQGWREAWVGVTN